MLTQSQIDDFHQQGFLIVDPDIPDTLINAVNQDSAALFDSAESIGKQVSYINHIRIQDGWQLSHNIHTLACFTPILNILEQLYKTPPLPFQTLNFRIGTQQDVHSDIIHFNSEPAGKMCGVWIALEDIDADQGPVVYYPGSHKLPPQTFENMPIAPKGGDFIEYSDYIRHYVKQQNLESAVATIKKGQVLIWAANLLHGGATQHNPKLTRLSQVNHYYFAADRYWRPSFSFRRRYYFEPNWLPKSGQSPQPRKVQKLKWAIWNRIWNKFGVNK